MPPKPENLINQTRKTEVTKRERIPICFRIGGTILNLKETSKFISLILRHKPETIGISLDEHGWADVDELIAGISRTHELNKDILEEIVRTDDKQRYSFNEDKTLIRADQGHSIPVDVELDEVKPPEELWHGTGEKYVLSIDEQGLLPKSRLYVHLSKDEETAVKVGKRHGKPVLYIVKAGKMTSSGHLICTKCKLSVF